MDNAHSEETTLAADKTYGLGPIEIKHPPGTFALTPASLISLQAIGNHQHLLHGIGLDWGSGAGCLAIAAAKIPAVRQVFGLDISEANIDAALQNARLNKVQDKTNFMHADSYQPFVATDRKTIEKIKSRVNFVLANPPSSEGDDGFEFRRIVLRDAREYLADDGIVFLSISSQYGTARIKGLERDAPGFKHEGLLASTELVPFDLARPDLMHCLEAYAQEEAKGGLQYAFANCQDPDATINAESSLALYRQTGQSPLSKWQTHLFGYRSQQKLAKI